MKNLIKKHALLVAVAAFFTLSNLSLYAKPVVYPDWYSDEGLEELYPSATYIRERGDGPTKEAAENNAVSYISRYFETHVDYSSLSEMSAFQSEDDSQVFEKTQVSTLVSSNMNLFGVKYTEPFYLKKSKTYYVVAYIDKKEAWQKYETEVTNEKDIFLAYYQNAIAQDDPINKIKLLEDARTAGKDFREKLAFANLLSEKLTKKTFGQDEQLLSSIPSLIKKEQIANPIYIEVNDDNSGVIAAAIRKAFSNLEFVVTGNSSNAACIAKVEVNYNQASGTSKIVYNPYMTLSLNGKAGSIYAFSTESEKVVAPNEAAAKKIAASDLAESINQKLESDIKTTLALN